MPGTTLNDNQTAVISQLIARVERLERAILNLVQPNANVAGSNYWTVAGGDFTIDNTTAPAYNAFEVFVDADGGVGQVTVGPTGYAANMFMTGSTASSGASEVFINANWNGTTRARIRLDAVVGGGSGDGIISILSDAIGFYGVTPVQRAAIPSTLADVITILQNLGLCH